MATMKQMAVNMLCPVVDGGGGDYAAIRPTDIAPALPSRVGARTLIHLSALVSGICHLVLSVLAGLAIGVAHLCVLLL